MRACDEWAPWGGAHEETHIFVKVTDKEKDVYAETGSGYCATSWRGLLTSVANRGRRKGVAGKWWYFSAELPVSFFLQLWDRRPYPPEPFLKLPSYNFFIGNAGWHVGHILLSPLSTPSIFLGPVLPSYRKALTFLSAQRSCFS
jgi:hypothetical protein